MEVDLLGVFSNILTRIQVKHLELRLSRIYSDLHTCVGYIQDPRKLKDAIKMMYAHHVPEPGSVSALQKELLL